MLTVGGMIGSSTEKRLINGSPLAETNYYRKDLDDDPCVIKVPRLTRKERLHLDEQMPCDDGWTPSEFELSADNVNAYRKIYTYYPSYAELLL